jgi:hypothetical protein
MSLGYWCIVSLAGLWGKDSVRLLKLQAVLLLAVETTVVCCLGVWMLSEALDMQCDRDQRNTLNAV